MRQNITGLCQQTFENKKSVDITHQCFAITPKQIFPPIILIFTKGEGDGIKARLPFKIFSILIKII